MAAEGAYPTGAPDSPAALCQALGALLAEGHVRLTVPPPAWFFTPQGAAWSPAGHVRHLIRSSRPLTDALGLPRILLGLRFGRRRGAPEGFEAIRRRYTAALAAGGTAPPAFLPRAEPLPADPGGRRAEILADWSRATVDLTTAVGRWPEMALARYQLPHPLLGPLAVQDMIAFTVYHTAHHLRRIVERDPHA
jgi:hypothetical protein